VIKVGVLGSDGRMGTACCEAVTAADDMELVARVADGSDLDSLVTGGAQVAIEFTTPDSVMDNVRFLTSNSIHAVVGTTGLHAERLATMDTWAKETGTNVFVAPNFALGAVLMMHFAAQAAAFYDAAEIVERHHPGKLDSPSGTSLRTAELMADTHKGPFEAPGIGGGHAEARGSKHDGVMIHSLRLPGSVAHQEVVFGGSGETLSIRHDSLDRTSFMPGVLMAVRKVSSLPGLTVGLERLLDL
jgi:4-hydroxy-tetrahydrodipicolinate reductase